MMLYQICRKAVFFHFFSHHLGVIPSVFPLNQANKSYWWMACQGNTLLTSEAGWPQRPCLDGKCPMTAQWIRDFTLRLTGQRHLTDSGEDGDGLGPTSFRSQILIVPNRIARKLRSRIVRRNFGSGHHRSFFIPLSKWTQQISTWWGWFQPISAVWKRQAISYACRKASANEKRLKAEVSSCLGSLVHFQFWYDFIRDEMR